MNFTFLYGFMSGANLMGAAWAWQDDGFNAFYICLGFSCLFAMLAAGESFTEETK